MDNFTFTQQDATMTSIQNLNISRQSFSGTDSGTGVVTYGPNDQMSNSISANNDAAAASTSTEQRHAETILLTESTSPATPAKTQISQSSSASRLSVLRYFSPCLMLVLIMNIFISEVQASERGFAITGQSLIASLLYSRLSAAQSMNVYTFCFDLSGNEVACPAGVSMGPGAPCSAEAGCNCGL